MMERIRVLAAGRTVYTNIPEGCYFLAGIPARTLPAKVDGDTLMPNTGFEAQMSAVGEEIRSRRAVLAYFRGIRSRWFLPSEEEAVEGLALTRVFDAEEGAVYS
jgi:hypothetical protein